VLNRQFVPKYVAHRLQHNYFFDDRLLRVFFSDLPPPPALERRCDRLPLSLLPFDVVVVAAVAVAVVVDDDFVDVGVADEEFDAGAVVGCVSLSIAARLAAG
jgi:hypothetical protein